ncbi:MAG: peptidoglycan DD-metalloendopeptidase family protein [Prevotellaceae bacterium]|nr:peptidoglycan DD-metalloendopeptidase family protein [Prevotellaceae bacterium]
MNLKRIKTISIGIMMIFSCAQAPAQDLLARQAPVDRKMNTVDPLELQKIMLLEEYFSPATNLYTDWNNKFAHSYGQLPDTFKIDLRDFCMPTTSRKITSNFGSRWGRQHKGLDVKVYVGDPIRAAFSGRVRVVRNEPRGYGNFVVIRHDNGLETVYGHLSKHLCHENQEVRAGDIIGLGGNTGRSTGSHLHFETRLCGVALNPAVLFDFYNQDVTGNYYVYRKNTYQRDANAASRRTMATINVGSVNSSGNYASAKPQQEPADKDVAVAQTNVTPTSPSVVEVPEISRSTEVYNSPSTGFHKVATGETLYSIAKRRGTTVDAICKLNHIGKDFKVVPGQILRY